MNLFDQIIEAYPELIEDINVFINGTINLRNDSDGAGDYIETWTYEKPIPEGLKLGK